MWFVKSITFLICCLNVFFTCAVEVVKESEIDNSLLENNVFYGVAAEILRGSHSDISVLCGKDLKNIVSSISKLEMWAIKVMDASGTYRNSFIWGQNAWLGSKEQCYYVNHPPKFTMSPDIPKFMDKLLIVATSPIEVEYKMIFLNVKSPFKIDPMIKLQTSYTQRLGLCLPKSCSNVEIEILSQRYFSQERFFQKYYNATMEVINVRNTNSENFLKRPEFINILVAICLATALVLVLSFANKCVGHTKMDGLKRFFKCFSINDNVASMFDTGSSPNAINSINGFRSLICLWVLLSHCAFYSMYAYDNLPMLLASLEKIEMQPIFSIIFYVDAFFVLSALLLTFNFLKDDRTISEIRSTTYLANAKLFTRKIVHRYIRLTPPFVFAIGISHLIAIYMQESSTFYIDDTFDVYCTKEAWWNSLFYIHNLFAVKDMCLSWSWYLACDMQFYIIILFILFVYARNPTSAKMLFFVLSVAMTVIGIYSNVEMNLLPRFDSLFYHLDEFYIEPWNRMHPYLAGVTTGFIMFKIKDKKFPNSALITIGYWIPTTLTILASLFITAFKDTETLNFALALCFGRYFMGLFIGSIIIMCHFGYGGTLNKVLASRFFVHLNKTTYVMYLVHPPLILYFNSNQESSPHFDVPSLATLIMGIILLSYVSAVVVSPIFEIPFQKLSDEYIMKKSKVKKLQSD